MRFEELLDAVPPVAGLQGRPRKRPEKLYADKGYDYEKRPKALCQRGTQARTAPCGVHSSQRLWRQRWVMERPPAWLAGLGKLRIRLERQLDT